MLTLAFAQIAWSVAFQWVELTGGDNGILGVWPDAWASAKLVYYYLALALCAGGALLLRADHLRAVRLCAARAPRQRRCAPRRSASMSARIRWLAFASRRASAGLAGGLFAYAKGSVFPDLLGIPRSVDALLMVLLGGVQTLSGPIVGALAFTGLQDQLVRLPNYWRLRARRSIVAAGAGLPAGPRRRCARAAGGGSRAP